MSLSAICQTSQGKYITDLISTLWLSSLAAGATGQSYILQVILFFFVQPMVMALLTCIIVSRHPTYGLVLLVSTISKIRTVANKPRKKIEV